MSIVTDLSGALSCRVRLVPSQLLSSRFRTHPPSTRLDLHQTFSGKAGVVHCRVYCMPLTKIDLAAARTTCYRQGVATLRLSIGSVA